MGQTLESWPFEFVKCLARYEGLYRNYIENSPIVPINLDKLEAIQTQRYYNKLFRQGNSSSQINYINKFLKQFLNYTVVCSYILKNPYSGKKISIPRENSNTVVEKLNNII